MTSGDSRHYREQNRRSWNAVTPIHNSRKRNQSEFLKGGGSTLFAEEVELLGDIAGKSLVHLQCNCGQDSLSLAQLGARVTGVDISDEAITFAEELSQTTGIDAEFVRSDVFDWLEQTHERFRIAFASYGVIGWLDDLSRWARGVARILRPGGRLVLLEFHPLIWSLSAEGSTGDPYFIDGPILERGGVNDYIGEGLGPSGFEPAISDFQNPEPGYSFQWTVADLLQSLISAGLQLDSIREYPYANGCEVFEGMEKLPGRRFGMPKGLPALPLMIGVVATCPLAPRNS